MTIVSISLSFLHAVAGSFRLLGVQLMVTGRSNFENVTKMHVGESWVSWKLWRTPERLEDQTARSCVSGHEELSFP